MQRSDASANGGQAGGEGAMVSPIQQGLQVYRGVVGAALVVVDYTCMKPCEAMGEYLFGTHAGSFLPNGWSKAFLRPVLHPEEPSRRSHVAILLLLFLACLAPLPYLCYILYQHAMLSLAGAVCVGVFVTLPFAGVAFFTLPWVLAWSFWLVVMTVVTHVLWLVFGVVAVLVLVVAYLIGVLAGMACTFGMVVYWLARALFTAPGSPAGHDDFLAKGGKVASADGNV